MKYTEFLLSALLIAGCAQNEPMQTLRVDYWAKGTVDSETAELISLTKTRPWSGPLKNMVDTADLGDYRVIVKDAKTDQVLYLQGFSTLFGEWRTTEEALTGTEAYYSSVSVPMPERKAKVIIENRNKHTMQFSTIGEFDVNPAKVRKCDLKPNKVTDIQINGKNNEKVDLTFIADGYQAEQEEKFLSDVRRFTEALFQCPPFDSYKEDFNVRAVMVPSDSAGVDFPGLGLDRKSALNSNYYTFGTDRYLTTKDMKSVSDAVWDVPTDAIFILVNEETYGGGGIYNFYAIGSSDNKRTLDVFIHEFGHSFGALADEYFYNETPYDQDTFYDMTQEPWEKNITTLKNFTGKWEDLCESGEAGLYEGGGYQAKGIWRPADHCMMRDYAPFCPACTRSIVRNINFLCDR